MKGSNQETNQARNRELVLSLLQQDKLSTRTRIAKQVGLKQATVANIINDFISVGLIQEKGLLSGEKGRRSVAISLSEDKYRVIAFRLTRRFFTIGVFSLNCREVRDGINERIENSDPVAVLDRVCDLIENIISSAKDEIFLAVGVSVPGPYYSDEGEIALITSFPGWVSVRIRDILQERISIPVIIEHDANAAVLAESILVESRKQYDTVVYISAGQGIGAGIMNGGKVFKGAQGIAGEIGHVCVDMHGPQCECGARGCLSMYASTLAITDRMQERMKNDKLDFGDVVKLIAAGNEIALEEFRRLMEYLSAEVINIIYTYNPNLIIIGDALSEIGQPILDEINTRLKAIRVRKLLNNLHIELAEFGFDSAYIGAAVTAAKYVFKNVAEIFSME